LPRNFIEKYILNKGASHPSNGWWFCSWSICFAV